MWVVAAGDTSLNLRLILQMKWKIRRSVTYLLNRHRGFLTQNRIGPGKVKARSEIIIIRNLILTTEN